MNHETVMMKGPKQLSENENRLVTRMGAMFPGERVVFRGKDLFHDLKDQRWMGLLLYGITGRLFNEKQVKLFEGIWTISASYPDPRIWNNRVVALAGTARSTCALGISAAIATSEASIYGGRPVLGAIDFFRRTRKSIQQGQTITEIVTKELRQYRGIPGYGRPIVQTDERIKPLMALANRLGYDRGTYVKLAFQVEQILLQGRWRMYMNVAALVAALAADQGLSPEEHYQYTNLCFTAGMFPCYIEATEKPEGTFLPLPCSAIAYKGVARRTWS